MSRDGYVVIPDILSKTEVEEGLSLTWDWLECLGSGVSRVDPATWLDENWPGDLKSGIVTTCGAAQQGAAWLVRGNKRVQQAFSSVWGEEELITSMDCVILWRPWWGPGNQAARPVTEGLHIDQNPFKKTGLQCVQGMVPLINVTKRTGGLQVVPRSHQDYVQDIIRRDHPEHKESGDFCRVAANNYRGAEVLIEANAGDLILWDSRLIHGGVVGHGGDGDHGEVHGLGVDGDHGEVHGQGGDGDHGEGDHARLARCAVTVCMVPRHWASQQVRAARLAAWETGDGMTHWPHEVNYHDFHNTGGSNIQWQYRRVHLDSQVKNLI